MPVIADAPMDAPGRKDPPGAADGAANGAVPSLGFLDDPLTTLAWMTDTLQ